MTFYELRAQWERREIRKALRRASGNVSAAASSLGLNRTHLYRKCESLRVPLVKRSRHAGSWAAQGL